MNDELTPEEQEALAQLPRERMPVGLEARVVDAMRDHGFLAKRRRTIALTNTRVAGVMAAGVALVIGAYSIGLHRGDSNETRRLMTEMGAPPAAEAPSNYSELDAPAPAADAIAPKSKSTVLHDAPESGNLQNERTRANETPATSEAPASDDAASAPAQRTDEAKKDLDWRLKPKEEERPEAKSSDAPPSTPELGRASGAVAPSTMAFSESVQRPLTFHLGGKTVMIEAPDNVRVVEDEPGKTLLIYTSDGLIRIRVTD